VMPGSGAWLELAPHELAAAISLGAIEAPVEVESYLSWSVTGLGKEDGALARLRSNGCCVEIRCSWVSGVRTRQVWAIAERGQVVLADDGPVQRLAVIEGTPEWIDSRPPEPVWEIVNGEPPLTRELRAFLEATPGDDGFVSDGALGLQVTELLDQVTSWAGSR
jgi:predicted dehydrogenase